MITAARAKFPTTPTADLLDCADAPGRAMTALRLGQKAIVLDPACPAFTAVSAIAASRDAIVLPHRPPCLDMMNPTAQRQLAAWLQPDIGAG